MRLSTRDLYKTSGWSKEKPNYPWAEKEEQYNNASDSQLEFARKDAYKAAEAMKGHNPEASNWYMDDYYTISDIMKKRREILINKNNVWNIIRINSYPCS